MILPSLRISKCRWGPVDFPVEPTFPISVPCLTVFPFVDADAVHVAVERGKAPAVVHPDVVAVYVACARVDHGPIGQAGDGAALVQRHIHPIVEFDFLVNGVVPVAKRGCEMRPFTGAMQTKGKS